MVQGAGKRRGGGIGGIPCWGDLSQGHCPFDFSFGGELADGVSQGQEEEGDILVDDL